MKRKLLLCFTLTFMVGLSAMAQQRIITGKVTGGDDGLGLPQVSVLLKGTGTGVPTDADGNYRISVPNNNAVLVFSFIGYTTQELTVGARSVLNVVLQPSAQTLNEVVVVGFGSQSKALLTDNVASIGSESIKEIPTSGFQSALVAKAPGVQITQVNGKVEGSMKVIIRGLSSVSASQEPLYVIDGIEMSNQNESSIGANLNPLLGLNPNDIESIDILKDASAAAIYGAKATNGVVLITTKKGSRGQPTVTVSMSAGIQEATNLRDWLNAEQYIELLTESYMNRTGSTLEEAEDWVDNRLQRYQGDQDYRNIDNDWQSQAFQEGYVNDLSVSISAGNDKTTTFLSVAYHDNQGIVRGNSLDRISARANIENQLSDKFTMGLNMSISETTIDRIAGDNAFVTPGQAIAQIPVSPFFNLDGEPNNTTLYANFLLQDKHSFRQNVVKRTLGKLYGDYSIMDNLSFRSEFGIDIYDQRVDRNTGRLAPFQSTNGQSFASDTERILWNTNNYFTYDQGIGDAGNLNVVLGMTVIRSDRRTSSVTGDGFPTDDFRSVSSAATISAGTGTFTAWSQLSYFLRATYSHNNKYIFKGSIRRDGSSRFGSENRYGNFLALSGAWRISEEDFLSGNSTLSDLKLRASWGTNGNTPIQNFGNRGLFGGTSYNGVSGLAATQGENPRLKWEETSQIDFGVDFGFLDNKISGSIDYYVKNTEDLIFNDRLAFAAGIRGNPNHSVLRNIGSLKNSGVEIAINSVNIETNNLTWKSSFNIATNQNEIEELPGGNDIITARNIIREGEAINSFYLVEYGGVDPQTGDALYVLNTTNPDGSINRSTTTDFTQAQRVLAGNPIPDWIGGLTNTVTYREFDFAFTFQGQWGSSIYNGAGQFQETGFGNGLDNQDAVILNRWQEPGDITDIPRAVLFSNNGHSHSTRYLQSANFIRLRNVSLGYTLPASVLNNSGLKNVRVYFTGLNLLTFTNFRGYDPESTNDDANTNTNIGSTFYSAPAAKVYTLGLNITF